MQVAREHVEIRAVQTALLAQISPAALAGMTSIQAATLTAVSEEGQDVFTELSFGNNKTGHQNLVKYMQLMEKMYSTVTGKDLCRDDGRVRPLKTSSEEAKQSSNSMHFESSVVALTLNPKP